MAQYKIGSLMVSPTQADFEQQLQVAHGAKLRPVCMCVGDDGLLMYIAHANNRYWLKRMPNTGRKHAVGCPSWESPEEFSGRNDLVGSALKYKTQGNDVEVALRLGFVLSRRGKRDMEAMEKANKENATAKEPSSDAKLTLRSLLHYLWDEAGLTTWSGISKPRDWAFVYDCLSEAAARKTIKHTELENYLYIPKPLTKYSQSEIDSDRRKRFAQVEGEDAKKVKHLLLIVGEVKEMKAVGGGWNVTFKEMPNYPFVITDKLHDQILRHLGKEMQLVSIGSAGSLVLMGTFQVEKGGTATFEEVSLMYVNENWIPYQSVYDRDLIADLIKNNRSFMRLLRYNRPITVPMPTLLLTDCGDAPVSIYVLDAESTSSVQMTAVTEASKYESILWYTKESGDIPEVPPKSEGTRTGGPESGETISHNPFAPPAPQPTAAPAVQPA
jgi:hypothetical protein